MFLCIHLHEGTLKNVKVQLLHLTLTHDTYTHVEQRERSWKKCLACDIWIRQGIKPSALRSQDNWPTTAPQLPPSEEVVQKTG